MSESDGINKLINKVYLPSSSIAYIFYKNLKEEKKNYNEIRVILISKDNSKQEFTFPIAILEKVEKRMPHAEKTINILKEKRFDEFKKTRLWHLF